MEKKIKIVEKGQQWLKYKPQALDIHQIAHPVDKALIKVLEKAHIKDILNEPMHQLVSANYGQLLATGIPLNQENFPELYALMQKTCTRLGIPIPYTIISNELSGINAFATGTDEDAFVVISNMAPRCLKPKELQFIISHECGHIAMEHMVYGPAALSPLPGGPGRRAAPHRGPDFGANGRIPPKLLESVLRSHSGQNRIDLLRGSVLRTKGAVADCWRIYGHRKH